MKASLSQRWSSLRQWKASPAEEVNEGENAEAEADKAKVATDGGDPDQEDPEPQAKVPPIKWRSAFDKNSFRTYYFNVETKEVTWKKPAELDDVAQKEEAVEKEARKEGDSGSTVVDDEKKEPEDGEAVVKSESRLVAFENDAATNDNAAVAEMDGCIVEESKAIELGETEVEFGDDDKMGIECSGSTCKDTTLSLDHVDPGVETDTTGDTNSNSSDTEKVEFDKQNSTSTATSNGEKRPTDMNNPAWFKQVSEAATSSSGMIDEPPTPTSSFPYTSSGENNIMQSMQRKAETRVVIRDICAFVFDMVGDWVYYAYSIIHGSNAVIRHHAQYNIMIYMVMVISIIGTFLSLWAILTSIGRKWKMKTSLCCGWTVPRLALSLVLLHHVPQFILTTYTDLTFLGGYSAAGVLNICSSMSALINTLATTKCGEGYCGDSSYYCGEGLCSDKMIGWNIGEGDNFEMGTFASDYDDTIRSDYEAMA